MTKDALRVLGLAYRLVPAMPGRSRVKNWKKTWSLWA
jgi:hypothetical protein